MKEQLFCISCLLPGIVAFSSRYKSKRFFSKICYNSPKMCKLLFDVNNFNLIKNLKTIVKNNCLQLY